MATTKAGQRLGFDFDRQKPVDRHILDFFSHELMLAIEIDGDSHKLKGPEDDQRQQRLEFLGIRFLRFDDRQVKANLDSVVLANRYLDSGPSTWPLIQTLHTLP